MQGDASEMHGSTSAVHGGASYGAASSAVHGGAPAAVHSFERAALTRAAMSLYCGWDLASRVRHQVAYWLLNQTSPGPLGCHSQASSVLVTSLCRTIPRVWEALPEENRMQRVFLPCDGVRADASSH